MLPAPRSTTPGWWLHPANIGAGPLSRRHVEPVPFVRVMGAIKLRLGAELRTRWRGWLGLALLLAVFAGLTFATAAGARRTDTAYQRLLARSDPYDMFLLNETFGPQFGLVTAENLRHIPLVVDIYTSYFFNDVSGDNLIGGPDPRLDRTFNIAKVVAGRLPNQSDPTEVAVPVAIAGTIHARVGGTLTYDMAAGSDPSNSKPMRMTFKVAGIIAAPGEFPPESDLGAPPIHLTTAFYEKYKNTLSTFPFSLVRLAHGSRDLPAFREALQKLGGGKPVLGYTQAALTKNVVRSFHLQGVALWLFAICLAIVTALVLGQALGRLAISEGIDYPTLRALGMTKRELFALGVLRAAIIAGVGSLVGLIVAGLLSPILPTGLARAADPNPGFHFDFVALLGGTGLVFATLVVLAVIPAARAATLASRGDVLGEELGRQRTSKAVGLLARGGASAPAVIGTRMALETGRGRTAVPVRTTMAGIALAIAALTITLSFGSSLNHLLHTPRLYGLGWDADVSLQGDQSNHEFDRSIAISRADPDVLLADSLEGGVPFFVDGVQADAMALPAGDDTFLPPIESGRAPRGADEIALGPRTMRRLHASIGDAVTVSVIGTRSERFTIVGIAVVPTTGHTANLGEGALVRYEALTPFVPGGLQDEFAVRFKPGVNAAGARARLQAKIASQGAVVAPPTTPGDLLNFGRSKDLPFILSGLLALLGLGTLAHALVTSINRRRRDFAICKTLGFTRGDVERAIAWQSSTFIVVSLAFGILAGVIAGRSLWNVYANQLGILAIPRVPAWTLALLVPVAALLANGLAVWPARSAARTRPAVVLRAE